MRKAFLKQFFGHNEETSTKTSMAFLRLKIHDEIIEAIDMGNLAEVNNLLRIHFTKRNNIDEDDELKTLKYRYLKQALSKNEFKIFYALIEQDAPIKGCDKPGEATFLHYAAEIGNNQLVETLLMKDADVLATNSISETPIHVAAKRNNTQIVYMLSDYLMESPDQNLKLVNNVVDNDGLSLFHLLCIGPHSFHIVDFLENVPIYMSDTVSSDSMFFPGYNALHFAAAYYRCETVKVLLGRGADINSRTTNGLTALHLACILNNVKEIIREAVTDMPMYLNNTERKLIFLENLKAGFSKRYELIKLLLNKNCDAGARDKDGNDALMYVMQNCYLNMEVTMKSSYMTDDRVSEPVQRSEIIELLEDQQLSIMKLLLQHYNDNNLIDSDLDSDKVKFDEPLNGLDRTNNVDYTPLHHLAAISNSSAKVVQFLLKCGADPNFVDNRYRTPLHVAVENENLGYINGIFNCKDTELHKMVNVNAQDNKGNTPIRLLRITTKTDNVQLLNECFCLLLKFGADIHIESEDGTTEFTTVCNSILQIISTSDFPSILQVYKSDNSINVSFHRLYIDSDMRNSCVSMETIDAIWKYLEMLRACNSYEYRKDVKLHLYYLRKISSKLHTSRQSINDRVHFVSSCKQEVDKMDQIHINKYTCLRDVLSKSIDKVASYTEDDELRNILKSSNFDDQFPIYGRILKAKFRRGLDRKYLLQEAKECLKSLLRVDIPQLCIERILSYSSDKMLRNLIETSLISEEKKTNERNMSDNYLLYPKTTKIS